MGSQSRKLIFICVVSTLAGCGGSDGGEADAPQDSQHLITAVWNADNEESPINDNSVDELISSAPSETDRRVYQMMKDMGTAQYLNLMSSSTERIRSEFAARGLEHALGDEYSADIRQKAALGFSTEECLKYYPKADRSKYHNYVSSKTSHQYYIDAVGKPTVANQVLRRLGEAETTEIPEFPRSSCSTKVGTWGESEDQGGHMIAHQLGGYNGRGNLTPQNWLVNQRIAKRLEKAIKRCWQADNAVAYRVLLTYPPGHALEVRPTHYTYQGDSIRSGHNAAFFFRVANVEPSEGEANRAASAALEMREKCAAP